MDKILKQIESNTSAKSSMSLVVSDNKTKFITKFNPPIQLKKDKSYEMALVNLETYYSFPNIDSKRNHFKYSPDNGATWFEFSLPIGCYNIKDINEAIQREIKKKGHQAKGVTIEANSITLKAILKISKSFQVDFTTSNSIGKALGFESQLYTTSYNESKNVVDILSVNSILVHSDIISSSYINGTQSPTIYSFFPNADPGYKIIEKPKNLVYLPIHVQTISNLETSITDQNGRELNLRGERITIRYHLREK